jgi:hypothetical protein
MAPMQEQAARGRTPIKARPDPQVLILLIPIAWLAILVLLLCICRVAADAEADPAAAGVARPDIGQRIVLLRTPLVPRHASRRPKEQRGVSAGAPRSSRRRVVAHPGR